MSKPGHDTTHLPGPSLWPVGFAVGIGCLLLGLVISWLVAAVGAALAVVFGILWARDVTREVRGPVPEVEPEVRAVADVAAPEPAPLAVEKPLPAYTRSKFLEATTVGVGAAIGAVVTVPVLGFAVLPPFTGVEEREIDLGPIENFPVGTYVIASYLSNPRQGEVSRRTAFVRNNGFTDDGQPSFTILYSRCVHLGCPVQPNGPIEEEARKELENGVELRPVLAQSFGCPCHGGLYDAEGNRQAGPPVRAMDRFRFSIKDGRLILGELVAVGEVRGTGANAVITTYPWSVPGTHVDGPEAWLYPIVPSQVTG
ncbi:MAG: Rieske 2Fe-2S domain-containing protein [Thermoleophilia bacterium]|nr:Rieske 2Fe-2S domain-containing protein [Gaiellaceae bacterium]MDW8337827.1 Rieske 2Fe-2S domain-containing protein [Thermoleophilia bacterium]